MKLNSAFTYALTRLVCCLILIRPALLQVPVNYLAGMPQAPAAQGTYDEDFSSYKNLGYTDQTVWDLSSKELRMRRSSAEMAYYHYYDTVSTADPFGNTFIAWSGSHNNNNYIFVQKLDPAGNRLWQTDLLLDSAPGVRPAISADDQGNALVAWNDSAQVIGPNGQVLSPFFRVTDPDQVGGNLLVKFSSHGQFWVTYSTMSPNFIPGQGFGLYKFNLQKVDEAGNRVFNKSTLLNSLDVKSETAFVYANIADLNGNALITWENRNDGVQGGVFAQAVDPTGNELWPQEKKISTSGYEPQAHAINGDSAWLVWSWNGAEMQEINLAGSTKWSEPFHFAMFSAYSVQSGVDDSGNVFLCGTTNNGGISVQKFDPNGNPLWANPAILRPAQVGEYAKPSLTIHPDGSVIGAWPDLASGAEQILAVLVNPDGSRQRPLPSYVNDDTGSASQTYPAEAIASDGSIYAAWLDNRRGSDNIYLNLFGADGQPLWKNDMLVNAPTLGLSVMRPVLVLDSANRCTILWYLAVNTTEYNIYAQKFDLSGNRLQTDESLIASHVTNTTFGGNDGLLNPQFAVTDGADGFFLGYRSLGQIMVARFGPNDQALWANPIQLTTGSYINDHASLALDAQKGVYVIWDTNQTGLVNLQLVSADGKPEWAAALPVNQTPMVWPSYGQSLAVDSMGNVVVVWSNGNSGIISGQKFSPSGGRLWNNGQDLALTDGGQVPPFVVIGSADQPLVLSTSDLLTRLDAQGQVLWKKPVGNIQDIRALNYGMQIDPKGAIVIGTQHYKGTNWDTELYKLDANGNVLWSAPTSVVALDRFYLPAGSAVSGPVDALDNVISIANLTADVEANGGSVVFSISNDGGQTWEAAAPGTNHRFISHASDLRWKADLTADPLWPRAPMIHSVHIIYTANDPGMDNYEPDDTCVQAQPIDPAGIPQQHTFHLDTDEDWVAFDAVKGQTYAIQTTGAQTAIAAALEVYANCADSTPLAADLTSIGRDARLLYTAVADGGLFVRAKNKAGGDAINQNGYTLSVHHVEPTPMALIVVGSASTPAQQAALDASGDRAYRTFASTGIAKVNLRYYSPSPNRDVDGNGKLDDITGAPQMGAIRASIQDWPRLQELQIGLPFYVMLIGPGSTDAFRLTSDQAPLTAASLNLWLGNLQATTGADKFNVIIDATDSGSFINVSPAGLDTLVAPNRVIIASAAEGKPAYLSQDGSLFSDAFFNALGQQQDLTSAFTSAAQTLIDLATDQVPQMNDTGELPGSVGSSPLTIDLPGLVGYTRGLTTNLPPAPFISDLALEKLPGGAGRVTLTAQAIGPISRVEVNVLPCQISLPGAMPLVEFSRTLAAPVAGKPGRFQANLSSLNGCSILALAVGVQGIQSDPAVLTFSYHQYIPVIKK